MNAFRSATQDKHPSAVTMPSKPSDGKTNFSFLPGECKETIRKLKHANNNENAQLLKNLVKPRHLYI